MSTIFKPQLARNVARTLKFATARRLFTDRSFRLANVVDFAVAQKYRDRINEDRSKLNYYQQSERKPRDMSKQLVIDLSQEQGYKRGHIPGAVNLPVDVFDYTKPVDVYGGISLEDVKEAMRQVGINDETSEIILYDNSGMLSSRMWFVLRYFGFRNIRILQGGWRSWLRSGLPVSEERPQIKVASSFSNLKGKRTSLLTKPTSMVFDFEKKLSKYVDTRSSKEAQQYSIEGAINIPVSNFVEDSLFKSVDQISKVAQSKGLSSEGRIIFYSQRGLSSCAGLFAFNIIGCDHVSLYDAGIGNWKSNFESRLGLEVEEFLQR